MLLNIATRNTRNRSFPSGLMRRMGREDAIEGLRRQHGSPEYDEGYRQGLKDSGRAER